MPATNDSTPPILTPADARHALRRAWPQIVAECRSVLGSELHYQAMIYHCLRDRGAVPPTQIGMNVKQWIANPITALFQEFDLRKHENYRGGFEPIPDIVIFKPEIAGDWRRRNHVRTLASMLLAIEVKASERDKGRLTAREIRRDLQKLAAHRDEARHRGADIFPVMMIVDTAPDETERTKPATLGQIKADAQALNVAIYYLNPETAFSTDGNDTCLPLRGD